MTRRGSVGSARSAGLVAFAFGALLLGGLHGPAVARAASPEPTPDAGGDTRTAGEGPGLVGAPGFAIGGVILLGLMSAGLTLAYVRFSGGPRPAIGSAVPPARGGSPRVAVAVTIPGSGVVEPAATDPPEPEPDGRG
ncbi:MAG: hypothetical protein ACHQ3P_03535 [Candidatus Limnocylindrales bacterium]